MLKEKTTALPDHEIRIGFDITDGSKIIGEWRKIIQYKASCDGSKLSSPKADASGNQVAFQAELDLFNPGSFSFNLKDAFEDSVSKAIDNKDGYSYCLSSR